MKKMLNALEQLEENEKELKEQEQKLQQNEQQLEESKKELNESKKELELERIAKEKALAELEALKKLLKKE